MTKKTSLGYLSIGSQDSLQHCCGVNEVGGFEWVAPPKYVASRPWEYRGYTTRPSWWNDAATDHVRRESEINAEDYSQDNESSVEKSGTGYLIATFNDAQKAEYEAFSKLVKILYQSPPKRNRGGNRVFVVVAQNKPERKPRNKLPKL